MEKPIRPLSFHAFRISFAKEIMATRKEAIYRWETPEYVMLNMYAEYLAICGLEDLANKVASNRAKVRRSVDGMMNEKFNEEFTKNLTENLDEIYYSRFLKLKSKG